MAAESEQADESGGLPTPDSSPAAAGADDASNTDDPDGTTREGNTAGTDTAGADDVDHADGTDNASEVPELSDTADTSDDGEEIRPEDVREGVVDLVAYAVGAVALILLGYFTQRDVLTWTRGPFTVVVIIMAVHWVGRRVQARREKVGGAR
ncbi:hypothetical protein [Streptodolium elevatio]|uniref:Uncharacterized protein n=1 Tax=Streptodolium elevatio TaxID=3157996 RepID=A0ABV3DF07_9ACTN